MADRLGELVEKIKTGIIDALSDRNPPPIPTETMAYRTAGSLGEAAYIPYVLAQVGHLGRGGLGMDKDGNLVFYLRPQRMDAMTHIHLITAEEVWVVLKPRADGSTQ